MTSQTAQVDLTSQTRVSLHSDLCLPQEPGASPFSSQGLSLPSNRVETVLAHKGMSSKWSVLDTWYVLCKGSVFTGS